MKKAAAKQGSKIQASSKEDEEKDDGVAAAAASPAPAPAAVTAAVTAPAAAAAAAAAGTGTTGGQKRKKKDGGVEFALVLLYGLVCTMITGTSAAAKVFMRLVFAGVVDLQGLAGCDSALLRGDIIGQLDVPATVTEYLLIGALETPPTLSESTSDRLVAAAKAYIAQQQVKPETKKAKRGARGKADEEELKEIKQNALDRKDQARELKKLANGTETAWIKSASTDSGKEAVGAAVAYVASLD